MPGIHPRRTGCGENAAKRESATAALSIIVLCLLGATIHCGSAEVPGAWNHLFQDNVDYVFAYNSTALLPESRTSTLAKVLLRVVNSGDDWQEINVQPIATGTVHSTPDTTPDSSSLDNLMPVKEPVAWFSFKRRYSGEIDQVFITDDPALTKLQVAIAQLLGIDISDLKKDDERFTSESSDMQVEQEDNHITITMTKPPQADQSSVFSHSQSTKLVLDSTLQAISSVWTEDDYKLNHETSSPHPVPAVLKVQATHNLTLLETKRRTRSMPSKPATTTSHTLKDLDDLESSSVLLPSLKSCLAVAPLTEKCEELLQDALWKLPAQQQQALVEGLSTKQGVSPMSVMSYITRSPSAHSQIAAAQLLLPPVTQLFANGYDLKQLLENALFHWAGLPNPQPELVTGLTKHCMSRVTPFDDASLHRQCAVTLGAISARLLESAVSAASGMDILTELHAHLDKLLLPGSGKVDSDDITAAVHALANAGSEKSFVHMTKAIDSLHEHPELQRTAIHTLATLPHTKVGDTLSQIASSERYHRHVRSVAESYLQRDGKRSKRQVMAGSSSPAVRTYRSASPSVNWHNEVGSKDIGASFGSSTTSNISQEVDYYGSKVNIDIQGRSWVQGQLGYIGKRSDLLEVRASATGSLTYDRDIMKDYQYGRVQQKATMFDAVYSVLAVNISSSLQSMVSSVTAAGKASSLASVFSASANVLSSMSKTRADLQKDFLVLASNITRYAGNASMPISGVVQHVQVLHNTWEAVSLAFNTLYEGTITQQSVDLPFIAAEWASSVDGMLSSLAHLYQSPEQSVDSLSYFNTRLRAHIKDTELLVRVFQRMCRQTAAANCSLFLSAEASQLSVARTNLTYWMEAMNTSLYQATDDKWKLALNVTLMELQGKLVPWLNRAITEVSSVQSWLTVLLTAVATMQAESLKVNQAIEQAESEVVRVSGLTFHHAFPNRLKRCDAVCQCSQYPFTAAGTLASGLPLAATAGTAVVAPLTGIVRPGATNSSLVLQPTGLTASFMTLGLHNILPLPELASKSMLVRAGTRIGTVLAQYQCESGSSDFLHVTASAVSGSVDPNPFISDSSQGVTFKEDWTNSGTYSIFIRNKIRQHTSLTESVKFNSVKAVRTGATISVPSLATGSSTPPILTVSQSSLSSGLPDYHFPQIISNVSTLGHTLWPAMSTDLADVISSPRPPPTLPSTVTQASSTTVGKLQQRLQQASLSSSASTLTSAVDALAVQRSQLTCQYLPTASMSHLRQTLQLLGLSSSGTRQDLVARLQGASNTECTALQSAIPSGAKSVYQFNGDCSSGTACVDIESGFESLILPLKFQHSQTSATVSSVVVSLGDWTETITFNSATGYDNRFFTQLLINDKEVHVGVTVLAPVARLSLRIDLCNLGGLPCQTYRSILATAQVPASSTPVAVNSSALLLWSVARLQSELDFYQLSSTSLNDIFTDFQQAVIGKASIGRSSLLPAITDEFVIPKRISVSASGTFTSGLVNFFEERVSLRVGALPLTFVFGASGHINISIGWSLDASNYKAILDITPTVVMSTYGRVRAGSSQFAEASLTGQLVNVQYKTQTESNFGPLPLTSKISINETLLGSRVVLATRLVENLVNGGEKDLSRNELWDYVTAPQSDSLQREHSRIDSTPPVFYNVAGPPVPLSSCSVEQLPYRSIRHPAVRLSTSVKDEDSVVNDAQYFVGTAQGLSDVLPRQPLKSPTVVIPRVLSGGTTLYLVIEVASAGNTSTTSCVLSNYESQLPQGLVIPAYAYSSHPNQLLAGVAFWDQFELWPELWRAIGTEPGIQGSNVLAWESFPSIGLHFQPTGVTSSLQYFSSPQPGQLDSDPREVVSAVNSSTRCASICHGRSDFQCIAFDYSRTVQDCRLHTLSLGSSVQLVIVTDYNYYTRLGFGHAEHLFTGLSLVHNQTLYVNGILRSKLGHAVLLTSNPVLIDLTPPLPGNLGTPINDTTVADGCTASSLQRCIQPTPIQNHRLITDSVSSKVLFNGHSPLSELTYTHINNFVSAHWNGFSDPETGIWGYTWCVGSALGLCDVVSRRDPHANILAASEWTNTALESNLLLADGTYYVTVQALNAVVYGGALVTTVQHSTGLVVDTTPPAVHQVSLTSYTASSQTLVFSVNASDSGSPIQSLSYGLGRSTRDVLVQDWQSLAVHATNTYTVTVKVPFGVDIWVRVQVQNRAGLSTAAASATSFVVDTSPPSVGVVRDGERKGTDIMYQSSADIVCANWDGFEDPESGISHYLWSITTSNPAYNAGLPAAKRLPSSASADCTRLSPALPHNVTVYSTITAVHDAVEQLNATKTSDGVIVDQSAPLAGQAAIGRNGTSSGPYWSETYRLSAFWSGFKDPESGISQYDVSVLHTTGGSGPDVIASATMPANQLVYDCYNHDWEDGDRVQVQVAASNAALENTTVMSQVVTIDSSPAVISELNDGAVPGVDQRYVTVNDTIAANWNANDRQSGVAWYEITVNQLQNGNRMQVWPVAPAVAHRQNASTSSFSTASLPLTDGSQYSVVLSVMNGAGLMTHAESDGVLVDTTRPVLRNLAVYSSLPVGLVPANKDESENLLLSSTSSLAVSFETYDLQSGIKSSRVGIRNTATGMYVPSRGYPSGLADFGQEVSGHLQDLTLLRGDAVTGPFYEVTVMVEDKAGWSSQMLISDRIRVIANDTAGTVFDGGDPAEDIDYQSDDTVLTATFHGFEVTSCDIEHVTWAASTQRDDPEVDMSFTGHGLTVTSPSASTPISGHVHAPMSSLQGKRFFLTIRVQTACGTVLQATSDGVLVDNSPPVVSTSTFTDGQSSSSVPQYSADSTVSLASWAHTDQQSGVEKMDVLIGTYPGGSDILPVAASQGNQLQRGQGTQGDSGLSRYTLVTARNKAGLTTQSVTDPAVIDTTKPTKGQLLCSKSLPVTDACSLRCSWTGFRDVESGIARYEISLGSRSGAPDIHSKTTLPAQTSSFTFSSLKCTGGESYYASLYATNNANLAVAMFGGVISVDSTVPVAGSITVLSNHVAANLSSTAPGLYGQNVPCLVGATQLQITWSGFEDLESGISGYSVGLGTSPLSDNIQEYVDVPATTSAWTFRSLETSVLPSTLLYASVRAHNQLEMVTSIPSQAVVFIGSNQRKQSVHIRGNAGSSVQVDTSAINGTWLPSNISCARSLRWKIVPYDTSAPLQDYQSVSPDGSNGVVGLSNNNLALLKGRSYRIVAQSVDEWGARRMYHSGGISVASSTPLQPGMVSDGSYAGVDINYQLSLSEISATWTEFGDDTAAGQVQTYWVAVGTDRRYPATRSNVLGFVSVGKQRSYTAFNLSLSRFTVRYYVTVRAVGQSGATTEATSNGVLVGYSSSVTAGQVTIAPLDYQSSNTSIQATWDGFKSPRGIVRYEWAVSTSQLSSRDLLMVCNASNSNLQFRSAGKSTKVIASNLHLVDGATYFITVRAVDQSQDCVAAQSNGVIVDSTPPLAGRLVAGYDNQAMGGILAYSKSRNELQVAWSGFTDNISGIDYYDIAMFEITNCSSITPIAFDAGPPAHKLGRVNSYTFTQIYQKPGQAYVVRLNAYNKAKLVTSVTSGPVLVSSAMPIRGDVHDGPSWTVDRDYQNSTTELWASFTHHRNVSSTTVPCHSVKAYPLTSPSADWTGLAGSFDGSAVHNKLKFVPSQVTHSAVTGAALQLLGNLSDDRVDSSGYRTVVNLQSGGNVSFEGQSASGDPELRNFTVMSVVLWHGPVSSITTDLLQPTVPVSRAESVQLIPSHQAIGLQIHPAYGNYSARLLVWSRKENDTSQVETAWYNLAFDPSDAFHRYRLVFKRRAAADLWTMNVLLDDSIVITMAGVPPLTERTNFVAQLFNRGGFVPAKLGGVARSVTAHIRNVRFPLTNGDSCDFGKPFYSAESPIVRFEAAVGTWPGATNVQDFKSFATPCRSCPPGVCQSSSNVCDTRCASTNDPHVMQVYLSGLELSNFAGQTRDSELVCTSRTQCAEQKLSSYTSQPSFFVTIRSTNGAGSSVTSTSDGVRVDTTPPVSERQPVHFDVEYSLSESVDYQSSNTTIYASWKFVDVESDIVEYSWAIGSTLGGTELQDFVSVGTQTYGINRNLAGQLSHNGVYYVMVEATNGAGLSSNASSDGVTVITTTINQTQAESVVKSLFTLVVEPPTNSTAIAYTTTERREQAGVSWEGVASDVVYWRIGTSRNADDILPSTRINTQNTSDQQATIINARVMLGNASIANISELVARAQGKAEQESDNFFRLEPGRVFYQRVDVCNIAIRCANVELQPAVVCCRPGMDGRVIARNNTPSIILAGQANSTKGMGQLDAADGPYYVLLNSTEALPVGDTLVGGLLSSQDIQHSYSPAVSFISNPVLTSNQASRQLTGRFHSIAGASFYVTPISRRGLVAPVLFSVNFETTRDWSGYVPAVLFWNYATSQWHDIEDSCNIKPVVDWDKKVITGSICSGNITNPLAVSRRKRQAATVNYLSSEMHLIVAQLLNTTVNTPPRLSFKQQQPYVIAEDSATVQLDLSNAIEDDEKDTGTFSLTSIPERGIATISAAGILRYTPCTDCTGSETIMVKFTENPQTSLPQYTASSAFTISISNDNDPPLSFLFTSSPASRTMHSSTTLQTYAEANHTAAQLVARVAFYDYDGSFDTLTHLVETSQPLLGTLSVDLDFQAVGVGTSMPVDWPTGHKAASFSGDIVFTVANITYIPPTPDYTGSETFTIFARDSQSFLSSPQLVVVIDVLPSYCQNGGQCSHSAFDSSCQNITTRRSSPQLYTCKCPTGYWGQYCERNTSTTTAVQDCPAHTPRMKCPTDPCATATCPSQPAAVCRANYCGGCRAEWYVGQAQVKCSANVSDVCSVPETPADDLAFCLLRGLNQPCECPSEQVECPPDSIYIVERVDRCCVKYTCQCVNASGSCPSDIDCGTGLQPQPAVRGHQKPGWCCPVYSFDDIDECGLENGGCSHTCSNSLYTHSCSCPAGMNLHPDARTCGVCYADGVPHHLGDHAYVGKSWCTCEDRPLNRNRWYCASDHTDQVCEYNGQRYAIGVQITEHSTAWNCTEKDAVVSWQTAVN